jgi:ABC-2 type transport system ATP-binding protein
MTDSGPESGIVMNESTSFLQTIQLSKQFGDIQAVNKLDLQIQAGEVFGLLGPNGAGKSTTINMICGLLSPDAGESVFHGVKMDPEDRAMKARIGVCPQEIVLWQKLTCIEPLQFMAQMYNVPARQALENGKKLLQDLGLNEKRSKLAQTLSGGMQRRLNILMALVHDPELIILDEPEAGLDPQSRVLVREYIRCLARQKTIVFTTHNMDEADRICDRGAIMDHGSILCVDTPALLKHQHGNSRVLELWLEENQPPESLLRILQDHGFVVQPLPHVIIIRKENIFADVAFILQECSRQHMHVKEIMMRENSLEDVFIAQTGRRLRE